MKITKTSKQAKKEKATREARWNEVLTCPECGNKTELFNIFYLSDRYFAVCKNCGCEWESSKF